MRVIGRTIQNDEGVDLETYPTHIDAARAMLEMDQTVNPFGNEYDCIQTELNRMNETELQSDRAHYLMDRAEAIRKEWRK